MLPKKVDSTSASIDLMKEAAIGKFYFLAAYSFYML
jgi:hypothetical protein